ncbi:hypothetical protein GCM10017750_47140 [Streptomyces racemochromogenes]
MPALVAEAIWRGVQAPAAACSLTCLSVMPKQEQTYTRFTSLERNGSAGHPLFGEAYLTVPKVRVP